MIDVTIRSNGTMPRPLSPIRCERARCQPPKKKQPGAVAKPVKPRLNGGAAISRATGERNREAVRVAYKRLAAELGRRPYIREIAAATGFSNATVCHHLVKSADEIGRPVQVQRVRLTQAEPQPEAQPIWCEPPTLSVTEAAKRDYWAAWRRIRRRS